MLVSQPSFRGETSDGWRREMSAVFSKSSRNHLSCVSKRPILSGFVQCRLCICQNWPAGPLPYRISLEMKWLFPKSFRWKTISSVHTIYDLTDLTGEFSLRAKLSLRRLWSGRSVLTNGKHSVASDFALCALKIVRDRFYIIIARLQPPHPLKEKFAFPIVFPHSLSQSICPY